MIHESGENYLEQILILSQSGAKVRAVDLCAKLGFSRPTVSIMLRELRAGGFVTDAPDGGLALTESGKAIAERIYARHCLLGQMLMSLGVPRDIALEDACKIEHDISNETFEALKAHFGRRSEN